jgi:hypothetical protein
LSSWSRPSGIATTGTPAASDLITVPCPACVTTAAACFSTSRCGARSTTVTFAGASIASTGIDGPVVTSPRTGSEPSAVAARWSTPAWSM